MKLWGGEVGLKNIQIKKYIFFNKAVPTFIFQLYEFLLFAFLMFLTMFILALVSMRYVYSEFKEAKKVQFKIGKMKHFVIPNQT